jgi:hypothetical protein
MRNRSFAALLLLTVLFVAGAIYSVANTSKTEPVRVSGERMFPDLAQSLNDLAWMRLSRGSDKIEFAAIGGKWAVVEKGNYPAAPTKVRRLLLGLSDLTLLEAKTQKPELFSRLELEEPGTGSKSTLVQLQNRLGVSIVSLIVGKTRRDRIGSGNDTVYVRKPGENQTWLGRGSIDVSGSAVSWLDRRIIDIPAARVASMTFTDGDQPPLVLKRDQANSEFAVADPPPDTQFKSGKQLGEPAAALAALELDDVKPATDMPVPDGGGPAATFVTFDGLTVTLRLSLNGNVTWAALTVTGTGGAEPEAKAISASLGRWSFVLPTDRAKLLRTKLSDLTQPAKGS